MMMMMICGTFIREVNKKETFFTPLIFHSLSLSLSHSFTLRYFIISMQFSGEREKKRKSYMRFSDGHDCSCSVILSRYFCP